jgi:hypothetical protein
MTGSFKDLRDYEGADFMTNPQGLRIQRRASRNSRQSRGGRPGREEVLDRFPSAVRQSMS